MRDIQHFLTFMKEHQFTDLLKADDTMMHLYVEELTRQKLSNATITRRLASIRCFYQFLMQNYHVTVNPAKHIKLEKSPKIQHNLQYASCLINKLKIKICSI